MGSHHQFKRAVGASLSVTGWVQPGDTLLKMFGELQGVPCCRAPPPRLGPGQPLSQLRRMERPAFYWPLRAVRNAGLRINMAVF